MNDQLKPIPIFASEAEERAFWETHDSAEYVNWDQAELIAFPNLRMSPENDAAAPATTAVAAAKQPA